MDEITLDRFAHEHYNMLINIEKNILPVMRTFFTNDMIEDTRNYYFKKTIQFLTDKGRDFHFILKTNPATEKFHLKFQTLLDPLQSYLLSKSKFYPAFLSDKLLEFEKFLSQLNELSQYKYAIDELLHDIRKVNLLLNEFFLRQAFQMIVYAKKSAEETLTFLDNKKSPETEYRKLNIINILEDIIQNEYAGSDLKKIEVRREFERPCFVYGYKPDLSRALANIINNAIKYNDQSRKYEVYIIIKVYTLNLKVIIEVENWGPGIDQDELEEELVFEKKYRGRQVKQDIPGNGIGLYDARKSIEKCGGKIEIASERIKHNNKYITTVVVTLNSG